MDAVSEEEEPSVGPVLPAGLHVSGEAQGDYAEATGFCIKVSQGRLWEGACVARTKPGNADDCVKSCATPRCV